MRFERDRCWGVKLLRFVLREPLFDLSDSVPKLRVSYAAGIAKAVRDFLASGTDPFEVQHVFAFGPIESALVAVGYERESLFD
jgi:hypothetical protein